ncbi:Hypothetical predicted protein [Olea europaea subsp. europaea]|uniref:Uncharacterized protein n=1 Tax=Olea europaea subsp. europaea TaxID=158383 RepID=A0A8S0SRU4_OLEEU|nr:Hypothetical predicted protein [Olea europaea subsp. europaea]
MKNLVAEMGRVEDMAVILKRFGDEQSMLLDQYERLSVEVQPNQAILGRNMSEPSILRQHETPKQVVAKPVRQWCCRGTGLLKKLLKPILGKKSAKNDDRTD